MFTQVFNFNENVFQAAQDRIKRVFDNFENIHVSISGGKDSTVLCHLALQEAKRRNRKIGLFFLDEEVVYDSTYQQIKYLMELEPDHTYKLWLQIAFCLTNATSYQESQLLCWEEGKHKIWMRPKEKDSIHFKPWDIGKETRNKFNGLGFYEVLSNFENMYGNTAFLVGLRALESPNRWRTMMKNPGFEDIFWSTKKKKNIAFYPIFDWHFEDIWLYIYQNNLRYSKLYDWQFLKGMSVVEMRTSSLIHEKSFKSLVELPEFEPQTYEKLLKRIKGISFANETAKKGKGGFKITSLPKNFRNWIEYKNNLLDSYPDENMKHYFEARFAKQLNNNYVARQQCRQLICNDYENNLPIDNKPDPRELTLQKWRDIL